MLSNLSASDRTLVDRIRQLYAYEAILLNELHDRARWQCMDVQAEVARSRLRTRAIEARQDAYKLERQLLYRLCGVKPGDRVFVFQGKRKVAVLTIWEAHFIGPDEGTGKPLELCLIGRTDESERVVTRVSANSPEPVSIYLAERAGMVC